MLSSSCRARKWESRSSCSWSRRLELERCRRCGWGCGRGGGDGRTDRQAGPAAPALAPARPGRLGLWRTALIAVERLSLEMVRFLHLRFRLTLNDQFGVLTHLGVLRAECRPGQTVVAAGLGSPPTDAGSDHRPYTAPPHQYHQRPVTPTAGPQTDGDSSAGLVRFLQNTSGTSKLVNGYI